MRALLDNSTTVIELGDSLAGAYCGRLLLRLGATILRVEPPGGSPVRETAPFLESASGARQSAPYLALTYGKQIATADVSAPEGLTAVEELIRERADLIIMSGTASEWAAHGLTEQRIRELAPKAIVGRVTSFGDDGPYAGMVGGELQAQALGGLMQMVGLPDREPLRMGGYQAQYATGLALLTGFSLGLFRRAVSGEGRSFVTSVLETVSHIEWKAAVTYQADGAVSARGPSGTAAIIRTKDGFFAFYCRQDSWAKLQEIFDDPRLASTEFATEESRERHIDALIEVYNDCAAGMTKRELYHKCQAAGLPVGYMATMSDLLGSEQYESRSFFEDVDLGDLGAGRLPGAPWRLVGDR